MMNLTKKRNPSKRVHKFDIAELTQIADNPSRIKEWCEKRQPAAARRALGALLDPEQPVRQRAPSCKQLVEESENELHPAVGTVREALEVDLKRLTSNQEFRELPEAIQSRVKEAFRKLGEDLEKLPRRHRGDRGELAQRLGVFSTCATKRDVRVDRCCASLGNAFPECQKRINELREAVTEVEKALGPKDGGRLSRKFLLLVGGLLTAAALGAYYLGSGGSTTETTTPQPPSSQKEEEEPGIFPFASTISKKLQPGITQTVSDDKGPPPPPSGKADVLAIRQPEKRPYDNNLLFSEHYTGPPSGPPSPLTITTSNNSVDGISPATRESELEWSLRNLKEELASHINELEKLTEEKKELIRERDAQQRQNIELQEIIKSTPENHNVLTQQFETIKAQLAATQSQLSSIEKKRKEEEIASQQETQRIIADATRNVTIANAKAETDDNLIRRLQDEMQSTKDTDEQRYLATKKELEIAKADSHRQRARAHGNKNRLLKEASALKRKIGLLESLKQEQERDSKELRKKLKEATEKHLGDRNIIESLRADIKTNEQETKNLTTEISVAKTALLDASRIIDTMEREASLSKQALEELRKTSEADKERIREYAAKQLSKQAETLKIHNQTIEELSKKLTETTRLLLDTQEKVNNKAHRVNTAQSLKIISLRKKVTDLSQKLETAERTKKEEADRHAQDMAVVMAEALQNATLAETKLEAALRKFESEISTSHDLRSQIKVLQAFKAKTIFWNAIENRKRRANAKKIVVQLKKNAQETKRLLQTTQEALKQTEQNLAIATNATEVDAAIIKNLNSDKKALEEHVRSLQSELVEVSNKAGRFEGEMSQANNTLKDVTANLQRQANQAIADAEKLQRELDATKKELSASRKETQNTRTKLEDVNRDFDQLRSKQDVLTKSQEKQLSVAKAVQQRLNQELQDRETKSHELEKKVKKQENYVEEIKETLRLSIRDAEGQLSENKELKKKLSRMRTQQDSERVRLSNLAADIVSMQNAVASAESEYAQASSEAENREKLAREPTRGVTLGGWLPRRWNINPQKETREQHREDFDAAILADKDAIKAYENLQTTRARLQKKINEYRTAYGKTDRSSIKEWELMPPPEEVPPLVDLLPYQSKEEELRKLLDLRVGGDIIKPPERPSAAPDAPRPVIDLEHIKSLARLPSQINGESALEWEKALLNAIRTATSNAAKIQENARTALKESSILEQEATRALHSIETEQNADFDMNIRAAKTAVVKALDMLRAVDKEGTTEALSREYGIARAAAERVQEVLRNVGYSVDPNLNEELDRLNGATNALKLSARRRRIEGAIQKLNIIIKNIKATKALAKSEGPPEAIERKLQLVANWTAPDTASRNKIAELKSASIEADNRLREILQKNGLVDRHIPDDKLLIEAQKALENNKIASGGSTVTATDEERERWKVEEALVDALYARIAYFENRPNLRPYIIAQNLKALHRMTENAHFRDMEYLTLIRRGETLNASEAKTYLSRRLCKDSRCSSLTELADLTSKALKDNTNHELAEAAAAIAPSLSGETRKKLDSALTERNVKVAQKSLERSLRLYEQYPATDTPLDVLIQAIEVLEKDDSSSVKRSDLVWSTEGLMLALNAKPSKSDFAITSNSLSRRFEAVKEPRGPLGILTSLLPTIETKAFLPLAALLQITRNDENWKTFQEQVVPVLLGATSVATLATMGAINPVVVAGSMMSRSMFLTKIISNRDLLQAMLVFLANNAVWLTSFMS